MNPKKSNAGFFWLNLSWAYLVGIAITLISIAFILFIFLNPEAAIVHDLTSHWVVYTLGLLIGIFSSAALCFWYSARKAKQSLKILAEESKREMAKLMAAEQDKQNLEKALLQGQKLQAIGTLAGGIAHDFNNLLYAIRGYVDMAREDLDKSTVIHRNLGKVLEATDRGRELVSRILAFSRRQHFDYKPIHLQLTLENALALLKPTIPASVSLVVDAIPNEVIVTGNQTQLHQVIVNIVNNAVDAMDGEGTITFHVSQVHPSDEILKKILHPSQSQYCRIDITDTGYGMDQQTMQRIFEPFYTTKEVGKGTGLGLSTVHSIITNHQGLITVNSQLGVGTTFTILLPMLTEPAYDDMEK